MSIGVTFEKTSSDINAPVSASPSAFSVKFSGSGGSSGGSSVRVTQVVLRASAWVGSQSPYSQVVDVQGVTKNSLVDLQPSVEQLQTFHDKDLALVSENDNGIVTIFAIGDKPTNDYTIQATVTEVRV